MKDIEDRLRELEHKALLRKITTDILKKTIPPVLFTIGSIGFFIHSDSIIERISSFFFLAGSYLMVMLSLTA